ncbi:MAG: SDR family NAD(P)-dependent oxidoreductase, partial [Pseudomonadota bacterium]
EAADKIYSRWGGFLDALPFDPMKFGMPPNAVRSVDPLQLMSLEVIRRTLDDAGYGLRDFDRERASIIVGASGGIGDVGAQYALRSETARFAGELDESLSERLPAWTEDSFAGILLNVAAGRAANRLDFGGVNYAVDSACASSLTAVYQAVGELETGRSDMVIAGGIDTVQGPFGYLCFSKTQALSPRGRCSTFDTSADGIVISEGIAMVMLKRLADAERDGDRVYAVIKGAGGSSDGRARSMTAPHPAGQIRALQRSYGQAGYSPATVGLLEAHGTGTVAGDTAELQTVTRLLKASGAASSQTAIGSVKTLIGHTKATAGIAGLVKTCLALYHKVLPPHANVTNPSPSIASSDSPLYLVSDAMPWPASTEHPRRAGVSAFGFGGTNFHVTMEEYQGEFVAGSRPAVMDTWQSELLVWRAPDRAQLIERIHSVQHQLDRGAHPCLRDLSFSLAHALPESGETAAIVVRPQDPLSNRLSLLVAHLQNPDAEPLPPQAFFSSEPLGGDGKVAVVFAGQGSQYPNMMRELALLFPAFRHVVETADAVLRDPVEETAGAGMRMSRLIFPGGLYNDQAQQQAADALTRTDIAQPAIGVVEAGLWAVMQQMGLSPDMAAGHSYGEYAALYAAGAYDLPTLLELSSARGRYIVQACEGKDMGIMAAARAPRDQVEAVAARFDDLLVANHNSPQQSILSGSRESIASAVQMLQDNDIDAMALPVGAAFHSSFVAPAQALLADKLLDTEFQTPAFPVYSNTTAAPHSDDVAVLKQTLSEHLARPVEFVAEIEAMYAAGARVFVGLGPKNVQSSMVDQILGDRPHCVARIDDHVGGLRGLLCGAGALLAEHVPLRLAPLFEGRDCRLIDLDKLADESRQVTLPSHTWMLTGAGARRITDPPLAPLTLEQAKASNPASAATEPAAETVPQLPEEAAAPAANQAQAAVPPAQPAQAPLPAEAPAAQDRRTAALLDYQATMRAFVTGNERIVAQALGVGSPAAAAGAQASAADAGARPARTLATRFAQSTNDVTPAPAAPAPALPPDPATEQAPQVTLEADSGPLPRFVIRPQAESIDGIATEALGAGAWLITRDSHGIALHLKGLMEREPGVVPILIDATDVGNDAALNRRLETARRTDGGLRGVLHLAPVDLAPLAPSAPLDQWRDQARYAEKSLFRLLRAGADDLAGENATILAASGLGGLMGRNQTLGGLTNSGGASGLLKCVNEEWQTGRIRAVDLDPSQPADANAAHLLAELKLPGGRIEVGYREGRRYVFRTVERAYQPGESAERTPDASWVVLASGGARGITAELLRDLAATGATLVVTGRTPEPQPEDDATRALESDAELKAHFIRSAREAGDEVRPIEIQRKVSRLRNEREMLANLADLKAAGARIDYRVCDMADADATAELFAGIYSDYGRLDGVVHGAGIIEDKLLVDKTDDSWFRVFDIKADSAFLLARHLRPDNLRFVVLFTSVAGRYGNSGQTDYAAANEVVNRAAWALQQRYGDAVKVCAINWGPWAATTHGQGMVSAEAERKFAARGVRLVYPRAGRELFMHEITAAPTDEVEVIAGEGPWEQVESDYGQLAEG